MLSIKTMHKLVLNSNVYQLKQPIQKDRYTVLFEKELEKSPSLTVKGLRQELYRYWKYFYK